MPIRSRPMSLKSPPGTPRNNRGFHGRLRHREGEELIVGTVAEVENAGHALLPEQPEAVAKAVIEYLGKK
jgi:pimeloyl-ACP methyl ester carboxylesterase